MDDVVRNSLEPDYASVLAYSIIRMVRTGCSKFAKSIEVGARNYVMYERDLYPRTAKCIEFIPAEDERIVMMESLHDKNDIRTSLRCIKLAGIGSNGLRRDQTLNISYGVLISVRKLIHHNKIVHTTALKSVVSFIPSQLIS